MPEVRKRLFFALWPDPGCRRELVERTSPLVMATQGRPVVPENLHMTLAFLHSVDVSLISCIASAANRIEQEPFNLDLTQIGCWKRSRILWLGPTEEENELISPPGLLARALWRELADCGFSMDSHRYRPHVTLARKVKVSSQTASLAPIRWTVRDFVLAESLTGQDHAEYAVLQRFDLGKVNDISL